MKKYFGNRNEPSLNEYTYKNIPLLRSSMGEKGSFKNWIGMYFSSKRLKSTCYGSKSFEATTKDDSRTRLESKISPSKSSSTHNKGDGTTSTNTFKIVPTEYSLENFQRSNQDTSLTHKPAVFEGNWIQSGDLLTDCASSVGGELSLGQNLLIAYMPWEGYNFEDAILISERLVRDDLYTSVHIERYDIETYETKTGLEQITRDIPDITEKEMEHLDTFGIVKMGAWVEEGDILVGKVTPINKKTISPYQKLLYTILEKQIRPIRDSSLRAPKGIKAKVIDIKYFLRQSSSTSTTGKPRKLSSQKNLSSFGWSQPPSVPKVGKGRKASMLGESTLYPYGTKRKVENSHFFKKINSLFLKKMSPSSGLWKRSEASSLSKEGARHLEALRATPSAWVPRSIRSSVQTEGYPYGTKRKKEKLNFLRFYLFARLDIKNNKANTFNKTPGNLTIPEVTQLQSLLNSSNLKNKGQVFEKSNKKLSKKNKQRTNKKAILHNIESIHIYLAEKRKIQVGDKMAGRHGNKGIVSQILPIIDMPYLPDGTPLDMVLNPLGVPSRMNVGQIYECLLGLAGKFLGENYKVFSFDEIYGPEASRSFVFNKLYQARSQTGFQWLFDPNSPGKMRLYDGRTGESFDQKVTVGQAYILRLVHMVDDKIHMRSTGPYSLVTQQPLRGRSKQGGQRLGEMEVWAIEGYGAAFTLLEMLTIKSDDMTGRMTLWSNLILNKDISIGTPESFKVLICELQALCLDIGLFRYMDTNTKNPNSLREITSLVNLP